MMPLSPVSMRCSPSIVMYEPEIVIPSALHARRLAKTEHCQAYFPLCLQSTIAV
jgi:hypothetical protein